MPIAIDQIEETYYWANAALDSLFTLGSARPGWSVHEGGPELIPSIIALDECVRRAGIVPLANPLYPEPVLCGNAAGGSFLELILGFNFRVLAAIETEELECRCIDQAAPTGRFSFVTDNVKYSFLATGLAKEKSRLEQLAETNCSPAAAFASNGKPQVARDPVMEARDKWFYEQAMEWVPWGTIALRLKSRPANWRRIGWSSVKKMAINYAKRHNLPPIPRRNAGRPRGKKTAPI